VGSAKNTIPPLVALTGFTVAVVGGLYAGNSAMAVLGRGLAAMVACYALGLLARWVQERMEGEHERLRASAGGPTSGSGQSSTTLPRASESP